MFERLFSLLLHAKSGVFAGVFLIGTTGALVTATVQNGVTTITITQASPSPSASASPSATASHSASPTASPTGSPTTPSSSTSSSPSDCKSKFQAGVDATQRVNAAFVGFHTDLMHLRPANATNAQRKTIEDADKLLKQIRQSAVKAIHASTSCFKRDDDKMEQGDHEDVDVDDNDGDNNEQKDEHEDKPRTTPPVGTDTFTPVLTVPTPTPKATPSLVTGTDPKTIADNAVLAMKLVFDTATAGLPAPITTPSRSPKPSRSPEPKSITNGHNGDNKNGHDGKGDD